MGCIEAFFFDTYAFFEILQGNPNYQKYREGVSIVTTKLNLMELHYGLLLSSGKEEADLRFEEYSYYTTEITDSVLKKATVLKALHRKKNLSYVDCIGYIIATIVGIKFLTGDEQFRDMDNVEFVK